MTTLETMLATNVLPTLGLTPEGDVSYPKEGRIAHNAIIPTKEEGDILFRCYPANSSKAALGYGVERARFEVTVLDFLSSKGVDVPKPLAFPNGSKSIENDEWFIFAYPVKEGKTLEISDLSLKVAKDAGHLLNTIINVSKDYIPSGKEPDGDINYIKKIMSNFFNRRPDLKDEKVFSDMQEQLSEPSFLNQLSNTPKGLVHGDYFFENVLSLNDNITGVIDFGDAYYGHLLMDIAIGSMEFSMKEGENWDMDLFEGFIAENKEWLKDNKISYDLYKNVLLSNCARFTAHICNLEQDALEAEGVKNGNIDVNENPYVQRFYKFQDPQVSEEMRNRFKLAIS